MTIPGIPNLDVNHIVEEVHRRDDLCKIEEKNPAELSINLEVMI